VTSENRDTCVLIPAYKPDERLNEMIDRLFAAGFETVVAVDDGGGEAYRAIFEKASAQGAHVLTHPVNRGKGAALKTGLSHIAAHFPMPVVTADADGQHAVKDIVRVAQKLREEPEALVLGARDKKQMPPRSKVGNTITCTVLGLLSGLWIDDTQTGLRGIPRSLLEEYAKLEGDRYEYEMNMLLETRKKGTIVEQVTIDTIYIDDNKSSHFSVIRDSARIYGLMLRQELAYIGSALSCGLIDWALFALLHYLLPANLNHLDVSSPVLHKIVAALLPSGVGVPFLVARFLSSLLNYRVNRDVVFKAGKRKGSLAAYYVLVIIVMFASIQLIKLLTKVGIPAVAAKPIADLVMFVFSFIIQNKVIFRKKKEG
jgi:glycosyltransferase involved in cell wall biosynthesis